MHYAILYSHDSTSSNQSESTLTRVIFPVDNTTAWGKPSDPLSTLPLMP